VDRGIRKEISFIPSIASKECWDCKECFPLCPTEALQAAYVLTKALQGLTGGSRGKIITGGGPVFYKQFIG